MLELSLPWPLIAVVVAAGAALSVVRIRAFATAQRTAVIVALALLGISLVPSLALLTTPARSATASFLSIEVEIDDFNGWLLPFAALVYTVILQTLPRTTTRVEAISRTLWAEAIVLTALSVKSPVLFALCLGLAPVPLIRELISLRMFASARVFAWFAGISAAAMLGGTIVLHFEPRASLGIALVAIGIFARKGILPLHVWIPRLYEHAPIPAAIGFSAPMLGAYAAARVLFPNSPPVLLEVVGTACLLTAVYGAAVGLTTDSKRRALGYVFLSQSALVLVGLDSGSPAGTSGALVAWLATGLSLTGFAMTVAALEARRGALPMSFLAGGHDRMPFLAAAFLLLGLAGVGFPGTLGFVGAELLVTGATARFPVLGYIVLVASALNGITVLRMYLSSFCGARDRSSHAMQLTLRERLALTALVVLLVAGGLLPGLFSPIARRSQLEVEPQQEADPEARAVEIVGHHVRSHAQVGGERQIAGDVPFGHRPDQDRDGHEGFAVACGHTDEQRDVHAGADDHAGIDLVAAADPEIEGESRNELVRVLLIEPEIQRRDDLHGEAVPRRLVQTDLHGRTQEERSAGHVVRRPVRIVEACHPAERHAAAQRMVIGGADHREAQLALEKVSAIRDAARDHVPGPMPRTLVAVLDHRLAVRKLACKRR